MKVMWVIKIYSDCDILRYMFMYIYMLFDIVFIYICNKKYIKFMVNILFCLNVNLNRIKIEKF